MIITLLTLLAIDLWNMVVVELLPYRQSYPHILAPTDHIIDLMVRASDNSAARIQYCKEVKFILHWGLGSSMKLL